MTWVTDFRNQKQRLNPNRFFRPYLRQVHSWINQKTRAFICESRLCVKNFVIFKSAVSRYSLDFLHV
ncbi:MAG: hypothetical protein C0403_10680 [Desulfobacterium sp.]|nr:hypothetical protein [Desulfobacterium sp.]